MRNNLSFTPLIVVQHKRLLKILCAISAASIVSLLILILCVIDIKQSILNQNQEIGTLTKKQANIQKQTNHTLDDIIQAKTQLTQYPQALMQKNNISILLHQLEQLMSSEILVQKIIYRQKEQAIHLTLETNQDGAVSSFENAATNSPAFATSNILKQYKKPSKSITTYQLTMELK